MTSVFIGGSRRLGRMNAEISHRLDNIMEKRLCVLVGDANGFDKASQAYFADNDYREVIVYCTEGICRNNIGDWPIHAVEFHGTGRGREFYTAKDNAMLRDADFGLFAWDAKSKGTLRNVRLMADRRCPSSVYVSTIRKFVTIRTVFDAENLSRDMSIDPSESDGLFTDSWRQTAATSDGCDSL